MSGSNIALDTNQAIAILNGAASWITSHQSVSLPIPVVGELVYGARNSTRVAENLARVERLVSVCRLLVVDLDTARRYAVVRARLKAAGTPIPENDIRIAALCLQHGMKLASSDEHFTRVEDLELVNL